MGLRGKSGRNPLLSVKPTPEPRFLSNSEKSHNVSDTHTQKKKLFRTNKMKIQDLYQR